MATINLYAKGDRVKFGATFYNESVVVTDPTTITLKIITPALVQTSYTYALGTVLRTSTGIYYMYYTLAESGTYEYRWEGTGLVATVAENILLVNPSHFT